MNEEMKPTEPHTLGEMKAAHDRGDYDHYFIHVLVDNDCTVESLWHVEPDPYAAAVLKKHWPGVRNLERVEFIDGNTPRPDIVCGGFPCQDISTAGRGAGLSGPRSGLWWEFARAISILRPRIVVLENVAALLARGLTDVLGELARLGFDAEWTTLRASDVGAPHRRNRVFIVGLSNAHGFGRARHDARERESSEGDRRPDAAGRRARLADAMRIDRGQGPDQEHGQGRPDDEGCNAGVGDTDCPRRPEQRITTSGTSERAKPADPGRVVTPDERGLGVHGRRSGSRLEANAGPSPGPWPPAPGDTRGWARWPGALPGVRRSAYGAPRGMDARRRRARLRCLGNAVVPQQAEAAVRGLWERMNGESP